MTTPNERRVCWLWARKMLRNLKRDEELAREMREAADELLNGLRSEFSLLMLGPDERWRLPLECGEPLRREQAMNLTSATASACTLIYAADASTQLSDLGCVYPPPATTLYSMDHLCCWRPISSRYGIACSDRRSGTSAD